MNVRVCCTVHGQADLQSDSRQAHPFLERSVNEAIVQPGARRGAGVSAVLGHERPLCVGGEEDREKEICDLCVKARHCRGYSTAVY